MVHETEASEWDSVADLRRQLQAQLELPPKLQYHDGRRGGGHELLFRGELLGEHMLLADYELATGDTVHFAVRRSL